MKKHLLTMAAFAAICVCPSAWANQVGVIAAAKNSVTIERGGKVIAAHSGDAIREGDTIRSKGEAAFQLIMMDETVFTLSKKPQFKIDHFAYDAQAKEGKLRATHTKGELRFATGHITDGTEKAFIIAVPDGEAKVRGTIGFISVMPSNQAQQQFPGQTSSLGPPNQPVVFAALNGPGPLTSNNAVGSFNFSTPNGDVDLNRPNAAVLASPDAPPIVFLAPPSTTQTVSSGSGGGNDSGTDTSGTTDDTSGGTDFAGTTPPNNDTTDLLFGANDAVDPSDLGTDTRAFGGSLQELIAANSGSASGSGTYTGDITGDFDFLLNFANRTFDLQSYNLTGGGLGGDSIDVVGGSAALPNDTRTSITLGNNGEDFPATVSGDCVACSVTATFPSDSSISATVTNGAFQGTTGEIGF